MGENILNLLEIKFSVDLDLIINLNYEPIPKCMEEKISYNLWLKSL